MLGWMSKDVLLPPPPSVEKRKKNSGLFEMTEGKPLGAPLASPSACLRDLLVWHAGIRLGMVRLCSLPNWPLNAVSLPAIGRLGLDFDGGHRETIDGHGPGPEGSPLPEPWCGSQRGGPVRVFVVEGSARPCRRPIFTPRTAVRSTEVPKRTRRTGSSPPPPLAWIARISGDLASLEYELFLFLPCLLCTSAGSTQAKLGWLRQTRDDKVLN